MPKPLILRAEDFGNESSARILALLQENAGEDPGTILSDERARDLMDRLVALSAEAEEIRQKDLYSSEAAAREAWLRLGILSRQRAKRESPDYDRKESLQAEIQALKDTLRAVSAEP